MRKMKARHGKNLVQPLTRQTVCSALDRPQREYADMRPSVPGSLASNGQDSGIRCQSCQATGQDIPAGRSEERRVGNGCVRTCRSRWSTEHKKKNKIEQDNDLKK